MLLSLPTSVRVWLASGATDLRKGFDTLGELVREQLKVSVRRIALAGEAGAGRAGGRWWGGVQAEGLVAAG